MLSDFLVLTGYKPLDPIVCVVKDDQNTNSEQVIFNFVRHICCYVTAGSFTLPTRFLTVMVA